MVLSHDLKAFADANFSFLYCVIDRLGRCHSRVLRDVSSVLFSPLVKFNQTFNLDPCLQRALKGIESFASWLD